MFNVAAWEIDFRARIQKGIVVLNEKVQNWRKTVDRTVLSLESTKNCLIGQLGATVDKGYCEFLDSLGIELGSAYGFDCTTNELSAGRREADGFDCYKRGTELWLEALAV